MFPSGSTVEDELRRINRSSTAIPSLTISCSRYVRSSVAANALAELGGNTSCYAIESITG
jgi:hypothetical protein